MKHPRPLAGLLAGFVTVWVLATRALADGVWFDIGVDAGSYVYESAGGASWEYFPPFPFGETWPSGTLVYAELAQVSCDLLPSGCLPGALVAGYVALFDGASCGCGGSLYGFCTLRLAYDPNVVAAMGADESQLIFAGYSSDYGTPRWVAVDGAVVDAEANHVQADIYGSIAGGRYYGLFRSLPPPPSIQDTTWSRIKLLWR